MNAITLLYAHKLPVSFYRQKNVTKAAKALLGKLLVTTFDGILTAGRITETEAYNGINDKASHAWNGRRTRRTETMYAAGGVSYVYLCYGIHHLFNVVTNEAEIPHAVLIRSIEPVFGINTMLQRTGKKVAAPAFAKGPGNVSKALGIKTGHTGMDLQNKEIFIADDGYPVNPKQIIATPRIGVDYAAEDALLPYRFVLNICP